MKQNQEDSEKAVQYLFGDLNETERDAMEERLFTDEEFSLFLDAEENELIDQYVRSEMDFAERQNFEKSYLVSESRREKVRIANILQGEIFTEKSKPVSLVSVPKVSVWQTLAEIFRVPNLAWAGGFATILLLILITGFLLLRRTNTPPEIVRDGNSNLFNEIPTPQVSPQVSPQDTNQSDNNQLRTIQQKSPDEKPKTSPPKNSAERRETVSPQPRVFAVILLPPIRSGDRPTLLVPPDAQIIRLRVEHNNTKDFIKYRVEIRDSNGDLIWSREIAVSEKTLTKSIILNVRGGALISGSYELTLSGITADRRIEEVNFYNFTVRKK